MIQIGLPSSDAAGFAQAIAQAGTSLAQDDCHINLPDGTIDLTAASDPPISLNNISSSHQLTIQGSYAGTTIKFPLSTHGFFGNKTSNLTLANITVERDRPMTAWGFVTDISTTYVILQFQHAMPTVADIYDPTVTQGRYLRQYTLAGKLVLQNNDQVPWSSYQKIDDRTYRLYTLQPAPYQKDKLVAVKSKHGGSDLIRFTNGNNISVRNVRCIGSTRFVFENINGLQISGYSVVHLSGQILTSNEGGPQISACQNVTVDGFLAHATGDDSLAFFSGSTGIVRNTRISDSFARGILLDQSPGVTIDTATVQVVDCPIERV